jgi:hypothetical protein
MLLFLLTLKCVHRRDAQYWQATVMLAANVGFLATQNISAPAEAASSISLVLSIGSIISGLLLVRRNRTMAAQDMKTAVRYYSPIKLKLPIF